MKHRTLKPRIEIIFGYDYNEAERDKIAAVMAQTHGIYCLYEKQWLDGAVPFIQVIKLPEEYKKSQIEEIKRAIKLIHFMMIDSLFIDRGEKKRWQERLTIKDVLT